REAGDIGVTGSIHGDAVAVIRLTASQIGRVYQLGAWRAELGGEGVPTIKAASRAGIVALDRVFRREPFVGWSPGIIPQTSLASNVGVAERVNRDAVAAVIATSQVG